MHHADIVDIERQADGTTILARFRVDDMDLAEAEIELLATIRMHMQQETQFLRWPMLGGDGQRHR